MIKTFRDLKIWQHSMELVTAIYKAQFNELYDDTREIERMMSSFIRTLK